MHVLENTILLVTEYSLTANFLNSTVGTNLEAFQEGKIYSIISNRMGNNEIGILIQIMQCLYFIECQLGGSEWGTRQQELHIKSQQSDRICAKEYIQPSRYVFVAAGKWPSFVT